MDASAGRGGLAARHDEQHWFGLEAATYGEPDGGHRARRARRLESTWTAAFPAGPVQLRIEQQLPPEGFVPAAIGGGVVRLLAHVGRRRPGAGRRVRRPVLVLRGGEVLHRRVWGLYAVDGEVRFSGVRYRGSDRG